MNLNHLRAFVKVVQTKSYKEAAHLLSVSQPAITQRIQLLESHFQKKLLNRDSEGIQLTSQGEVVYKQSQIILKLWDNLENDLLGQEASGKLSLGASTIPSEYFLPAIIRNYRTRFPDVSIQMCISGSQEVIKWLLNHTVDVTVTGKPEEHPKIVSFPLLNDELTIIAPLDWDLTDSVTLQELIKLDWIIREPNSSTRRVWEENITKSGYHIDMFKIAGQMGSTEAVIAAVEAGLGISAISSLAAKRAVQFERVQEVLIKDFCAGRTFYVSCLKDQVEQPIVASFISYIKENAEN
ncbi:selenium metabolism-associated LysR family transcriptional regulator [Anaerobacillus sp. MEB173]|uniref:selenium metabolism-associated LysR family transcriptional regulator n=1 Tax=Anaerobacillus sp. MEB173 TaxID=3383345 RepID=UPI003F9032FC